MNQRLKIGIYEKTIKGNTLLKYEDNTEIPVAKNLGSFVAPFILSLKSLGN